MTHDNGNTTSIDSELYHHGVKGQKWGHRKAKLELQKAKSTRKVANREFNRKFRSYNSSFLNSFRTKEEKSAAGDRAIKAGAKAEKANKAYKRAKKKYKFAVKADKIKMKDLEKKYRKEYMSGQSKVGKAISKLTGSDRIYANIMADMDYRGHK